VEKYGGLVVGVEQLRKVVFTCSYSCGTST